MQEQIKDYTHVIKNIIADELEGRDSEIDCATWLVDMGLTSEDLEELGYDRLARHARDYE